MFHRTERKGSGLMVYIKQTQEVKNKKSCASLPLRGSHDCSANTQSLIIEATLWYLLPHAVVSDVSHSLSATHSPPPSLCLSYFRHIFHFFIYFPVFCRNLTSSYSLCHKSHIPRLFSYGIFVHVCHCYLEKEEASAAYHQHPLSLCWPFLILT